MGVLDDFIPPLTVVQGHADSLDVWRVIVSQILKARLKGFVASNFSAINEFASGRVLGYDSRSFVGCLLQ
jgi:hypothetical protein